MGRDGSGTMDGNSFPPSLLLLGGSDNLGLITVGSLFSGVGARTSTACRRN